MILHFRIFQKLFDWDFDFSFQQIGIGHIIFALILLTEFNLASTNF